MLRITDNPYVYHNELEGKGLKELLVANKSKLPTPKKKEYRGYEL